MYVWTAPLGNKLLCVCIVSCADNDQHKKWRIHWSIIIILSRVGLRRQKFQQGAPDLPSPGHISQLSLGVLKAFSHQCRDIIAPPGSGSAPGSPPSLTHLEHLPREETLRHPYRCLKHLNWLLLTLSPWEMPATLLRKLVSAACICDKNQIQESQDVLCIYYS